MARLDDAIGGEWWRDLVRNGVTDQAVGAIVRGFMERRWPRRMSSGSMYSSRSVTCMLAILLLDVPHPCQNEGETAVISGHLRASRTTSDLGMSWLTRCVKRPSKQRVARAYGAPLTHSPDMDEPPLTVGPWSKPRSVQGPSSLTAIVSPELATATATVPSSPDTPIS